MRRRGTLLLLLAACSSPPARQVTPGALPRAATPAPAQATTPKTARASAPVLLVVIVDQLGSWVFEQRRSSLSDGGAFAKLLREGLYAPELRYEHATTSTAPGHAALFTGLPPRQSGVFANERLDDATSKPVSMFADSKSRIVLDAVLDAPSSSSRAPPGGHARRRAARAKPGRANHLAVAKRSCGNSRRRQKAGRSSVVRSVARCIRHVERLRERAPCLGAPREPRAR
jgi:hypothetical protein